MKNIYLIRHGRQESKLCNVDVPLSEAGVRQAILLATRLQESVPVERIICSDLIRAKETANHINDKFFVPVEIVPEWREIDFGELTGRPDQEIRDEYADFFEERRKMREDVRYPGGENGQDVVNRVYPKLMELTKSEEDTIVVVTHGGLIRALVSYVLGMDMKNKLMLGVDLENTSITQLVYHEEWGTFSLERFNDDSHLTPFPELQRSFWKKPLM